MANEQYAVTGMTCAACQAHVEKAVARVAGVERVSVSLLTNSMSVEGTAAPEAVIRAVEGAGYGASPKADGKKAEKSQSPLPDTETPRLVRRLWQSALLLLILMYLTMGYHMWGFPVPAFLRHNHIGLGLLQMLLALAVMAVNRSFFVSGFRSALRLAPNMDTLVAMGSGVSFLWSLFVLFRMTVLYTGGASNQALMALYHDRLYFETAAMIPALITVGKTLESLSKGRTTDALRSLMRLSPKTATLLRDGQEVTVDIDEVAVGDVFTVRPGEAVPTDGVVLSGESALDESALTGESVPVDKAAGDTVHAAAINRSGFLKVRATRVGEDTGFAQIIRMVSDAAASKAPIARIADRVSGVFVPVVIGIALAVALFWAVQGADGAVALEHAIAVLVISCPCALGLATPVAIMVGSGLGARHGILFKTGEALETAGKVDIVVLDKTGTVTEGKPAVTQLIPADGSDETELLTVAYALERQSEHPLARAIVACGEERGLTPPEVTRFAALSGRGLQGELDGAAVVGGSMQFIAARCSLPDRLAAAANELAGEGKTPLFFEKDGRLLGLIAVADVSKPDSAAAVTALKNMGLTVVMLTGDQPKTAAAIGREAGVDRVIAGVLPDGKEAAVRRLQQIGRVAMVGDGINDAPALTAADLGIAISTGTDVAIDSADVVLMRSRLSDVPAAIRLSRAAMRNIRENLFWAFAYNLILIPVAAGLLPGLSISPMWGAAAMSLSSVTVCLNALRLNLFRPHRAGRPVRRRISDFDALFPADAVEAIKKEGEAMKAILTVEGMMCAHCEARVKKTLEALPGVTGAEVSHRTGKAVIAVADGFSADAAKKAVEDAGYTVTAVEA